jgi:hypothetical protein
VAGTLEAGELSVADDDILAARTLHHEARAARAEARRERMRLEALVSAQAGRVAEIEALAKSSPG